MWYSAKHRNRESCPGAMGEQDECQSDSILKMQMTCWLVRWWDFRFGASPAPSSPEGHCSEGLSIFNTLIITRIPLSCTKAPSSFKSRLLRIEMEEILCPTPSVTQKHGTREHIVCFLYTCRYNHTKKGSLKRPDHLAELVKNLLIF